MVVQVTCSATGCSTLLAAPQFLPYAPALSYCWAHGPGASCRWKPAPLGAAPGPSSAPSPRCACSTSLLGSTLQPSGPHPSNPSSKRKMPACSSAQETSRLSRWCPRLLHWTGQLGGSQAGSSSLQILVMQGRTFCCSSVLMLSSLAARCTGTQCSRRGICRHSRAVLRGCRQCMRQRGAAGLWVPPRLLGSSSMHPYTPMSWPGNRRVRTPGRRQVQMPGSRRVQVRHHMLWRLPCLPKSRGSSTWSQEQQGQEQQRLPARVDRWQLGSTPLLPRPGGQGQALADGGPPACRELQRVRGQLWVRRLSLLQNPCSSLQWARICPLLQPLHQEQVSADGELVCSRQGLRWRRQEQLRKHRRGPV